VDQGCLFRIPDPNFSIPDPGSKRFQIPDQDPHKRILVLLAPKNCFSALGKIILILFPDPDFFPISDL
jgi:hypothetical protein